MIVTERLYLTADRKTVVKDGDDKAAHIFAAKGQQISDVVARQYGLLETKKKRVKKAANKMVRSAENKASEGE